MRVNIPFVIGCASVYVRRLSSRLSTATAAAAAADDDDAWSAAKVDYIAVGISTHTVVMQASQSLNRIDGPTHRKVTRTDRQTDRSVDTRTA